ncbi:hypothetical protein I350_01956 [Cryptococcus amylolentus CBS 6273]|uniref:Uncharacterized protein n=1 Tax=Cryptococcus amylolentus CBS 6273 TaxID=1296118 RepID=A0A1E3K9G2_9TREE|nr:hypothetical protein I350_01956 [Cryptococcus amylolentus CBS 6273]
MIRPQAPPIQTQPDTGSATPSNLITSHRKDTGSDISAQDQESSANRHTRSQDQVGQLPTKGASEAVFSPLGTSFGADTPDLLSPTGSMVAMHGSVVSTPFPKNNDQQHQADWEASQRKKDRDATADSVKGAASSACLDTEDGSVSPEPVRNGRIIAIDFDDVCTQNMLAIITEHNVQYGTDLTLDDLESYVFWQNKGWGSPADCTRKVKSLNQLLPKTAPIPGFDDSLRVLHSLGHPIHIVTSRPESDRQVVAEWLAQQNITIGAGPEHVIKAAWFCGSYSSAYPDLPAKGDTASAVDRDKETNDKLRQIWKDGVTSGKSGLGKLRILRQIDASLFIDDHHGNLEPIIQADPPIPCLLFGTYGWNRSRSSLSSPVELMDYEERIAQGLPLPFNEILTGKDHGLHRVKDWSDVVQ